MDMGIQLGLCRMDLDIQYCLRAMELDRNHGMQTSYTVHKKNIMLGKAVLEKKRWRSSTIIIVHNSLSTRVA